MTDQRKMDILLLYVEDEAAAREEVSQFLRRRVSTLVTAANGEEGLERFRTERPDLIVTDIRMPVMDGLQMSRIVRQMNRGVPIIVTTAHSDTPYMLDAIDIGIDQYVVKPVDAERLSAALEKCEEIIEYRRAHKRYLADREQLIGELRDALAKVKLLSGMLPICASCKKIRDDQGYWKQIEVYIQSHSEAEFTHGICPDCAVRLYGKFAKDLKP